MNITAVQTALVLIFLALLVLLSDPFMLFMPPAATMTALALSVVILCAWAGFVAYEKANDEREILHRMHAGRTAYLAGLAMLTLALLVQGLSHDIDPWIAAALGVMVVAKFIGRIYFERRG